MFSERVRACQEGDESIDDELISTINTPLRGLWSRKCPTVYLVTELLWVRWSLFCRNQKPLESLRVRFPIKLQQKRIILTVKGDLESHQMYKKNEHKVLPPDDTVPTEKRTIKQKTFRPTLQFDSKKSNWRAGLNLFSSLLLIRCCRLMKAKKIKEFCLSILCFASSTT